MIFGVTIEWSKLVEAAYVSGAFGIGVILIAGFAVVASLRAQDRRSAHQGGAIVLDVLTGACVLAIAAAVVLGIFIMTDK
jgi:ribosomal protein L11 methylase PrmA